MTVTRLLQSAMLAALSFSHAWCEVPLLFRSYAQGMDAYRKGDLAAAVRLLDKSLYELPIQHRALAFATLAEAYEGMGDLKTADLMIHRADFAGARTAQAAQRVAGYFLDHGDAKKAADRSAEGFKSAVPTPSRALLDAVYAEALVALGQTRKGEAIMAGALETLARDPNLHPWEFGWTLVRSSRVAAARADFPRAQSQAEQAFRFAEPRWGVRSPLTLAALDLYASALARNGDVANARAILQRVLAVRRQIHPAAAPIIAATQARLDALPPAQQ